MLGFNCEYPEDHPKSKFRRFSVKKLQKISCKTFHRKTYFTWFREFVSNPLHKIVCKSYWKNSQTKTVIVKRDFRLLKTSNQQNYETEIQKKYSNGFWFLFLTVLISHVPVQKRVFKLICLQSGFILFKFT